MADLGLLAGLAQGLAQGVGAYSDTSRALEDQALKKRLAKVQEIESAAKMYDTMGYIPEGMFSEETLKSLQQQPDDSGLLAGQSGLVRKPSKREREAQDKDFQYQVSLAPYGQTTERDPTTGQRKIVEMSDMSPRAQRKTTKEELDIEKEKIGLLKAKKELNEPAKAKLSGDIRTKLGFIDTGLNALGEYEKLFEGGQRQTYLTSQAPLIGGMVSDKPIDQERTRLEEAIGRLASGGAINAGEEARFRRMIPRAGDTDDNARRKMTRLREEFQLKAQALGSEPVTSVAQSPAQATQSVSASPPPGLTFEQFKEWKNKNAQTK